MDPIIAGLLLIVGFLVGRGLWELQIRRKRSQVVRNLDPGQVLRKELEDK